MKNTFQIPDNLETDVQSLKQKLEIKGYSSFNLENKFNGYQYLLDLMDTNYDGTFDEYINDLASREILEEIIPEMSLELKTFAKKILEGMDSKFILLSEESVKMQKFAERRNISNDFMWYYRVPKKIKALFREDFI